MSSKTVEYHGFESILEFDEDWMEILQEITPNGEYQGIVKITMEYIPAEDEDASSSQP